METLDEFDNEYPFIITFCEQISPKEYEKQSLNNTQKSLQDLYSQMEQNPRICERILRKRKQVENEKAGLLQYLKAKFFAVFQGDVNYSNSMEELEMGEKVEQLKREMQKASDYYAITAKIVPRQQLAMRTRKNILPREFSPSRISLSDPQVTTFPQIFGPFSKQVERSLDSNTDLKQIWAGTSSVNQKSIVDLRPLMLNPGGFCPRYLGTDSYRQTYSSFPRTHINSPTSSSQSAGPSNSGSVFNTPILSKFRNNKDDKKDNENVGPGSHFTDP